MNNTVPKDDWIYSVPPPPPLKSFIMVTENNQLVTGCANFHIINDRFKIFCSFLAAKLLSVSINVKSKYKVTFNNKICKEQKFNALQEFVHHEH